MSDLLRGSRIYSGAPASIPRVRPAYVGKAQIDVDTERQPNGHRPRIPVWEKLAELVKDGMLMLPPRYRPGWFLDIFV